MVRGFRLVNEKGQEFSLMDIKNFALLTDPNGLGINYESEFERVGNTFVESVRTLQQGQISATLNFINYDNYKKFIDYMVRSSSLKLAYKVPYDSGDMEYFRDISITNIDKSEKGLNGIISENITIDCLSLWYKENQTSYFIRITNQSIIWDFKWDSMFVSYSNNTVEYVNDGHVPASLQVVFNGVVGNPQIKLLVENEVYQTIKFNTLIEEGESLFYSSRDNEFEISKIKENGSKENLFNLDVIDFENDNLLKIPINKSTKIEVSADTDITSAQISVFTYYLAV